MISWKQLANGRTLCESHNREFRTGHTCPTCAEARPGIAEAAEKIAKKRKAKTGLPSLLDHEKWFIEISNACVAKADEASSLPPDLAMSAGEWARIMDTAIKARTRAAEMAGKRDEYERMERLERSAEALKARRDNTARRPIH